MDHSTHLDAWATHLERNGLRPTTIRLYRRTIEVALNDFELEGRSLVDARPRDLELWLDGLAGQSSTTANRISGLRSFFRYLVRMEHRVDDPTLNIKAPKRSKGVPKPPDDYEAVLDAMDAEDIRANERKPSMNRRVGETRDIAEFIAETGLRILEACSVTFDGPAPDVFNITGKGNKEAPVFMTPKAKEAIDRLGGKIGLSPRAVQRRFERVGIHPHQLRHWRATSLVRAGVEIGTVSKIMRHSSPAITMVYAQYDESIMRAALEKAST